MRIVFAALLALLLTLSVSCSEPEPQISQGSLGVAVNQFATQHYQVTEARIKLDDVTDTLLLDFSVGEGYEADAQELGDVFVSVVQSRVGSGYDGISVRAHPSYPPLAVLAEGTSCRSCSGVDWD